jgi:collagenase-like PrtC family protease
MSRVELSLGPVLYNWSAEQWRDFYFRVADEAPVDIVYVGEVVCAKRAPFFTPYIAEVVERLERAGKQVVHSTLALVMSAREQKDIRELAARADLMVEANDLSAVAALAGRPHIVGPFVNVYNEGTLDYLTANGAARVVLPVELPMAALRVLAAKSAVPLEVQGFGRLPLALSARCYHARARGLHKDGCQYVCAEDADGQGLETLDGDPFLAINGTQTISNAVHSLLGDLGDLTDAGVACVRLWPQHLDMVEVAEQFRGVLDGGRDPETATRHLAGMIDWAPLTRGFYTRPEGL